MSEAITEAFPRPSLDKSDDVFDVEKHEPAYARSAHKVVPDIAGERPLVRPVRPGSTNSRTVKLVERTMVAALCALVLATLALVLAGLALNDGGKLIRVGTSTCTTIDSSLYCKAPTVP